MKIWPTSHMMMTTAMTRRAIVKTPLSWSRCFRSFTVLYEEP